MESLHAAYVVLTDEETATRDDLRAAAFDVLHHTAPHITTLSYTTLQYTSPLYTYYTTLHYTTLFYTTYTTLLCSTLRRNYTTLHNHITSSLDHVSISASLMATTTITSRHNNDNDNHNDDNHKNDDHCH